jgi:hypothetical protein
MHHRPLGGIAHVRAVGIHDEGQSAKARRSQSNGARGEHKVSFHAVKAATYGKSLRGKPSESDPARPAIPMRADDDGLQAGITQPIPHERAGRRSIGCRVSRGHDQQAHGARR